MFFPRHCAGVEFRALAKYSEVVRTRGVGVLGGEPVAAAEDLGAGERRIRMVSSRLAQVRYCAKR